MAKIIAKKKPTKKVAITSGKKVVKEVEVPVNPKAEVQDGVQPSVAKLSNKPPKGLATIGASFGVTLNMGDFQSARIDVFIQRNVEDTEAGIADGYDEISEILHEEIERQSAILTEEG